MPSLEQHQSSSTVKMLMIGDSGAGKTGALVSLVSAGYKLRILDFDNGLDSLVTYAKRNCPDKLSNVQFETLRDDYKSSPAGPVLNGAPRAFITGIGLLNKWTDGSIPSNWGPEYVLVVDSLTFLSDAAFEWASVFKPSKDPRQIYGEAQNAVEHMLALLTGASFKTNVIVTSHLKFIDMPDGTVKAYPTSIGKALSPTIPRYFNTTVLVRQQKEILTTSTPLIDLKNPVSWKLDKPLPLATGLATLFNALKGN